MNNFSYRGIIGIFAGETGTIYEERCSVSVRHHQTVNSLTFDFLRKHQDVNIQIYKAYEIRSNTIIVEIEKEIRGVLKRIYGPYYRTNNWENFIADKYSFSKNIETQLENSHLVISFEELNI